MSRERLLTSIGLAVLLHAMAFVLLELFIKLRAAPELQYTGPIFVQLQEQPVIQQARETQTEALPAQSRAAGPAQEATAGVQVQQAPAPGAAQLAPGAAAAPAAGAAGETPLKPKGPQFRLEGSAAQEAQAQPAPSGRGFQITTTEPTLPPAGLKSAGAPLRAETVNPRGPAGEAPALPLESVDRALAQSGGAKTGGGGAQTGGAAVRALPKAPPRAVKRGPRPGPEPERGKPRGRGSRSSGRTRPWAASRPSCPGR